MEATFEKLDNNEVLRGDGFYISYNPHTGSGHGIFTDLGNIMGEKLKDGEETALYNEKTEKWMILEGDFREKYLKAFPSYVECEKVYTKGKKDNRSNWSTD